jgi:hypothetical protein
MKKALKIFFFGALSWLIPFLASFPFFTKDGKLSIDQGLFKSIMVVVGLATGIFLTYLYFKKLDGRYCFNGFLIGLIWLVMNCGLDILVLLPMSKMALPAYFMEIGVRYLSIPLITIGMGCLLAKKSH